MRDKTVSSELQKVLSGPMAASGGSTSRPALLASGGNAGADGSAGATVNSALASALAQNTSQLSQVRSAIQGQLDSLVSNTQALIENTTTKSSAGSTAANVAGGFLNSILGGGLLGPIVSGVMSLFGGGGDNAPAPLSKLVLPPKIEYQGGIQGVTVGNVDYGQNGLPRPAASAPAAAPPQITVNVNAMDSRSFLDRSGDIANAVRKAMLESSALNDVIGEL